MARDQQLDLPMAPGPPGPDRVETRPTLEELQLLRQRLPPTVQFGTSGWVYPGWAGIVWRSERSTADLERDGLREYAQHPLLSTVLLNAGEDVASERDLRRYAGQLPDSVHCILQVHPDVTTPRHTRRQGGEGQANPRFLDSRFFLHEILSSAQESFGERLGPFLFTFPPIMARSGISDIAFAERLERFIATLPDGIACAVEVREPELLTLLYAEILAANNVSHVFTTWPGMPSLPEQARAVPASPELIVRIVDPTGEGTRRTAALAPFDRIRHPDPRMRDDLIDLLAGMRGVPTYVLVENEAEGSAPLTIVALARQLLRRLEGTPG